MCQNLRGSWETDCACNLDHKLVYPLITGEHHCKDYCFKPDVVILPPRGKIFRFSGYGYTAQEMFPECYNCAHNFMGRCTGLKWIPIKKIDGICEFFREKGLICKNAIPMLQYPNHARNNYCKCPPHLRDGDGRQGWKWLCPNAHTKYVERKSCYAAHDVLLEKEKKRRRKGGGKKE